MADGFGEIVDGIAGAYNSFLNGLPNWVQNFVNLFLLVIIILIYSIIIWKFYRFIAIKNVFGLNLNKYNKPGYSFKTKIFAGTFYFLEYIIIIPFIIFFGFALFTFFLILLTTGIEISVLLIVAAVIIAAVRMASYYKEDLSRELAKLLPLNLLAIAMLTPNFFNLERVLQNFAKLSTFFSDIIIYFLFIIILEILLRFFDFIFSLFGLEEEGEEKE